MFDKLLYDVKAWLIRNEVKVVDVDELIFEKPKELQRSIVSGQVVESS